MESRQHPDGVAPPICDSAAIDSSAIASHVPGRRATWTRRGANVRGTGAWPWERGGVAFFGKGGRALARRAGRAIGWRLAG